MVLSNGIFSNSEMYVFRTLKAHTVKYKKTNINSTRASSGKSSIFSILAIWCFTNFSIISLSLCRFRVSALWTQLEVRHSEAEVKALAQGLDLVVDKCPQQEVPRLRALGLM